MPYCRDPLISKIYASKLMGTRLLRQETFAGWSPMNFPLLSYAFMILGSLWLSAQGR